MFISNYSSISILVLISLGFLFGTIVQTIFLFYFSKIKIIFYGGSKFKFGNDEKNFVYVVLPSIFVGFLILINNNLIAMYFGSAQAGNISYIYFANRFSHILVDIYGIALGTVLMPHISKAIIKKDFELTNKLIANSIKILFFGLLPACFGVFYLSDSLIYLFFERGAFNDISTANTSLLLRGYVPGVVALCLSSILMTLYFALSKTKLLVIITLTYTLISYFLLKILYDQFDIAGIGYGTSISAWIFVLILYVGIKKEQIFKISFEFLSFFFRSFFYSSLMIITLVILNNYISFDRNYMLVFMVCSGVIFYCLMILLFEKKISKSVFMYLRKINL
tara:strand:- start:1191 stop:2198 length:1008 start_codon:yes stop_codon:yes gene_type:complete